MAVGAPEIAFCNAKVRPGADNLAKAYFAAKNILATWFSGPSSEIPNDGTIINDGAAIDGRPIITGAEVHNLINRLSELITDYEAAGNAKLNTILAVAVNTSI